MGKSKAAEEISSAKKKLKEKEEMLERAVKSNWAELKDSAGLSPGNKKLLPGMGNKSASAKEIILKRALTFAATMVAQKLIVMAINKLWKKHKR